MKQRSLLPGESLDKELLDREILRCITKIRENLQKYGNKYPDASAKPDNRYRLTDNIGWTTGFWSGQTWLCYELSGDEFFKQKGLEQVESFRKRLENHIDLDHHDIGFLYSLSCVSAWKILGDDKARDTAIRAARILCQRFTDTGDFIQAWGKMYAPDNYRLIIDCYMNLPLLYWAHQETGEVKLKEIADKHAQTALITIRKDFSTYHTYFFDLETGTPLQGVTAQGYTDDSPWARGQAWGIYGMALAYNYTQEKVFYEKFLPLSDFFLTHLPKDFVSYWDLTFTEGDQARDTSATAISSCAILAMLSHITDEKAYLRDGLHAMMNSLMKNYATTSEEGLVTRSTYNANPRLGVNGVDVCCSFGDYFYLEALTRLKKTDWKQYW